MQFLDPTTHPTQNNEVIEETIVQIFATPAAAYRFGEIGRGEIGGGGGGIVMDQCNICNNPKTNKLCIVCNPGITIPSYCSKCKGPYNNCY